MKVYIGPYPKWFGPYHFMDFFSWILPKRIRDNIADRLPMFPFMLLNKLSKEREIKVKLHPYDTWDLNTTLSYIIVPLLKQLKETKHGFPVVITEYQDPCGDNKTWLEENEMAWVEILNKMIWAFEQASEDWEEQYHTGQADYKLVKENQSDDHYIIEKGPKHTLCVDQEGIKAHREKMQEGFELFGKYYKDLWD